MAAGFTWYETNGASVATSGISNVNWKNIDDSNITAYNAAPITAGNNSYEKWQYGEFTGTFNTIQNGYWDQTSVTALGTGLTLKSFPSMTASGLALSYTTPSTSTNALLTRTTTYNGSFPSGAAVVFFGGGGPNLAYGKAASSTANPCFTNYLTTQLQTTVSAAAGDTASLTFTLRYDEN